MCAKSDFTEEENIASLQKYGVEKWGRDQALAEAYS